MMRLERLALLLSLLGIAQGRSVLSPLANGGQRSYSPQFPLQKDILNSPLDATREKALYRLSRKWTPGNTVPYTLVDAIKNNETKMAVFNEAIEVIHNNTCVRWVNRSSEVDYVQITAEEDGCYVDVLGRVGGAQILNFASVCFFKSGFIVHEMFHVLGIIHEHQRPDRDSYIRVIYSNLIPGVEEDLRKFSTSEVDTLNFAYDYGSLMHYYNRAFSKNGNITIQTKDPDAQNVIGQTSGPSVCDLAKLNWFYRCPNRPDNNDSPLCSNNAPPTAQPCENYSGAKEPWRRLWSAADGDHAYFVSESEENETQDALSSGFRDEGIQGQLAMDPLDDDCFCLTRLYHLYNSQKKDHFYTTDRKELEREVKQGYSLQPVAYYCVNGPVCGASRPLFRFWNFWNHDHFYMTSIPEFLSVHTNIFSGYSFEKIECLIWT